MYLVMRNKDRYRETVDNTVIETDRCLSYIEFTKINQISFIFGMLFVCLLIVFNYSHGGGGGGGGGGLLNVNLCTVVLRFLFFTIMKTIPIHIVEVETIYPFIYYSVKGKHHGLNKLA